MKGEIYMEKITVSEFKKMVYEEFKEEINAIVKASEKEPFTVV